MSDQEGKQPVPICGICGRRLRWPGWNEWTDCECGMQTKWQPGGRRVMRPIQWKPAPPRGRATWKRAT
jgi:hypothetical protein